MAILKLVGIGWLICLVIFSLGLILGAVVENFLSESNPIKKWWRRHIAAPDPYDNDWKNFNG